MKRIPLSVLIIAVISIGISCNSISKFGRHIEQPVMPVAPIYVLLIPHDTIRPKSLTEAQKQAMVSKFFKDGYEKNIQPQFDKLYGVIDRQSVSIKNLTETLTKMRTRAIHNRDSMQRVEIEKEGENQGLRRQLLAQQTKETTATEAMVMQNSLILSKLKPIVTMLLWGFASLWGMFLLSVAGFYLWIKKLKSDIKRAKYA